jgi:hypothetical protein
MKFLWTYAALVFLTGCASTTATQQQEPTGKLVATFAAPHTNGRLYDGPCDSDKVLLAVPPQFRPEMKAAVGTYQGKPFGVCWTWNVDESAAIVVWDDGGAFAVPRPLLKFALAV